MNHPLIERMAQVSEILIQLAGSPIPSQQFQVLVDYANLVVPHSFLAFCLIDEESDKWLVFPLVGLNGDSYAVRPLAPDEGILGRVLSSGQAEIIPRIDVDPDALVDLEAKLSGLGNQSALIIPIQQQRKVVGALYFAAPAADFYTVNDLQIGRLLAAGLASSLETSRLYQRLADERSTLSAVLTSTKDGIVVVNELGTVLLANPAFEAMFDLAPGFITGQQLKDHVRLPADLGLSSQNGAADEFILSDGRTVQASSTQVVTEFGELVGWAAVFRDITLLKELEEMKNEFVNTVSHDLKNPINVITLSGDLLTKVGPLNDEQKKLRERIGRTAVYMNELVTELLDLGKIQAGLDLQPTAFNLAALIQKTISTLEPAALQKQIQLNFSQQTETIVTADERRLQQVMLNLIGNAIKYTPEQGQVTISVKADPEQSMVEVSVSDTGIGIPAQDLPHIFDNFFRVQSEETKNIKGTGLGLAITKSIIEAHNGRIWVKSNAGRGSTFTFTLP